MKVIIALFTTLLFVNAGFCDSAEAPKETWTVVKDSPLLSTSADFSFKIGAANTGHVVRSGLLCPRYYYDLYDAQNQFQARGISRAFSLGLLFSWGMEIDVYDPSSIYVGSIRGQVLTKTRAKFVFNGPAGETRAVAYLNSKKANLLVVAPIDQTDVIAELSGDAFGDVSTWTVKVRHELSAVDEALLKVFAAFAADYHSSFSEPPKQVINYNFNSNTNYRRD